MDLGGYICGSGSMCLQPVLDMWTTSGACVSVLGLTLVIAFAVACRPVLNK